LLGAGQINALETNMVNSCVQRWQRRYASYVDSKSLRALPLGDETPV
jgi:hypothetical protein